MGRVVPGPQAASRPRKRANRAVEAVHHALSGLIFSCADPGVERHAVMLRSGLYLSRSIRRRILANSALRTATSASSPTM